MMKIYGYADWLEEYLRNERFTIKHFGWNGQLEDHIALVFGNPIQFIKLGRKIRQWNKENNLKEKDKIVLSIF